MSDPVLFLLSVLTILATPGPSNTLLATSGALAGVRRSLPLLFGELTGYLLAIAVIRTALAPVLQAAPEFANVLKVGVALYLALMSARLWSASVVAAPSVVKARRVFVTTLFNPKAFIFAASIIPHDVLNAGPYFLAFATCVIGMGFLWVMFGQVAGSRYCTVVPRVASVALAGFASLIVVSVLH